MSLWTDHGHAVGQLQSFVVYTDAANQAAMLLQSRVTSSGHVFKNYVSFVPTFYNYVGYTLQTESIQKRVFRIIFNLNCIDYENFCRIHQLQTLAEIVLVSCVGLF